MESGRFKVVIADSELTSRRSLDGILGDLQDVEVVFVCDEPKRAFPAIDSMRADIAFIDASALNQGNVDQFKRASDKAAIVVVANSASGAFLAFENEAVDYLLKPYDRQRVIAAIGKAARMRGCLAHDDQHEPAYAGTVSPEKIICTQGRRRVVVEPSTIVYAIARGNYVELNTEKGAHLLRATFGSVLAQLGTEQFVVANRSVVVRRAAIRRVERFGSGQYSLALSNGTRVRTSRNYRKFFRNILESR